MAEKVKGRIVLVGAPVVVGVDFTPAPLRTPDEQARARYGNAGVSAGGATRWRRARPRRPRRPKDGSPRSRSSRGSRSSCGESRPALRIFDAGRPHGQIAAVQRRRLRLQPDHADRADAQRRLRAHRAPRGRWRAAVTLEFTDGQSNVSGRTRRPTTPSPRFPARTRPTRS